MNLEIRELDRQIAELQARRDELFKEYKSQATRVRHLAGISDPSPEAASIQINDLGFPKRAFFKPL